MCKDAISIMAGAHLPMLTRNRTTREAPFFFSMSVLAHGSALTSTILPKHTKLGLVELAQMPILLVVTLCGAWQRCCLCAVRGFAGSGGSAFHLTSASNIFLLVTTDICFQIMPVETIWTKTAIPRSEELAGQEFACSFLLLLPMGEIAACSPALTFQPEFANQCFVTCRHPA